MSGLTAQADGKLRSRAQGHGGQGVSAPFPAPQNNQLQELPYNELSRLSGLRTLNLHNNRISSEGEGDNGRRPLPTTVPAALSLPPQLGLWAGLRQFPALPFAEQDGNSGDGGQGLWLLRTWGAGPGEPLPVPGWMAAQTPPCPHPTPGVPSPPTSFIGLPDEAFESLTQLQHIYVAHNKVSPPHTHTHTHTHRGAAGLWSCSTKCRWDSEGWGAGGGPRGPVQLCSRSSLRPPSFCPAPSVSRIWLLTK